MLGGMALTPGRRALRYGIIGFLVVAVPAAVLGIAAFSGPRPPEFPNVNRVLGMVFIIAGVIVGSFVGAISALIGGSIDRKARKRG